MEIIVIIIAVFVYLVLKKYIDYVFTIIFTVMPDIVIPFVALFFAISVVNYVIHRGD